MAVHRDWLNGGVYSLIWRYLNAKGLTQHTQVVFRFDNLRLQIARSSWGGRRHPPYAFTEQGIAMLSGVLNSKRAIAVNIAIMRTFVRLRQLLATHEELARRVEQVEVRQNEQGKKSNWSLKPSST